VFYNYLTKTFVRYEGVIIAFIIVLTGRTLSSILVFLRWFIPVVFEV